MGRKNRNARRNSYSYSSFSELKGSTVKFDLTQAEFAVKTSKQVTKCMSEEVGITVSNGGTGQGRCLSFSVRSDVAERLIDEFGRFWTCGIVKAGGCERLYIIPSETGFAIFNNKNTKNRRYFKIPIGDREKEFEKYTGKHDLRFDEDNEAYYFLPVN